jgi:ABC-type lipopolysaccharide export system ATPase subunit
MSLLVVKKLTKNINNRNIINDINFSINPAEIVGLLGP